MAEQQQMSEHQQIAEQQQMEDDVTETVTVAFGV
jgi:hypothetical protein